MDTKHVTLWDVPQFGESGTIYHFLPKNYNQKTYDDRVNRSQIGFFPALQPRIKQGKCVIFGNGGIGGNLGRLLHLLGVGTIVLVDNGVFDISNIQRQLGASIETVGKSKSLEVARILRNIIPDTTIIVCTDGATPDTVYELCADADLAFDAIEYHALGARYTVLEAAENLRLPIFNGNSSQFATNMFFWPNGWMEKTSPSFKELWPFSREYAYEIENAIATGQYSEAQYKFCCNAINKIFFRDMPNYGSEYKTADLFFKRLSGPEKMVTIFSPNPAKAAGNLAIYATIFYSQSLGAENKWDCIPPLCLFPDYLYEETALRKIEIKTLNVQQIRHELSQDKPR